MYGTVARMPLDVRFVGPVVRNDLVTAHARVAGIATDTDGEQIDFDVWVTNQAADDQTVITGIASYRLGVVS